MQRLKYFGEDQALQDLGCLRNQPAWLERDQSLPFSHLSDDEFEILCYLLLLKEHPQDDIYYYGKTGDGGRDIVWVRENGSIELIQCKNFQRNVGIKEIKDEFSKICFNCYRKLIPENPSTISFYVSSDLTPKALHVIQYFDEWRKLSQSALEKYLSTRPERELLDFASSWKPNLSHETGITLTERIKKKPGLIDSFFRVKKVTDNSEIRRVDSKLDTLIQMLHNGKLSVDFPSSKDERANDPISPLVGLLRKAEENALGVAFKTNIDSSGVVKFSIYAKPGNGGKTLCNLSFPSNELGSIGRQKFKTFVEEGRDITLSSGEFSLEYLIPLPFQVLDERNRKIRLEHSSSNHKIPIRIEVFKDTSKHDRIDLAYLQFTRAGTKEFEITIQEGNLVGKVVGVISRTGESRSCFSYFGSSEDLNTVKANHAKASISLALNIIKSKKIIISPLENPEVIWELREGGLISQTNVQTEFLEKSYYFLEALVKINKRFSLDLRYPKELTPETAEQAELISTVIDRRLIRCPSGNFSYKIHSRELPQLVDFLKKYGKMKSKEPLRLSSEDKIYFEILGFKTPEVESKTIYDGVRFTQPVEEIERLSENYSDDIPISIDFQFDSATQNFGDWLD